MQRKIKEKPLVSVIMAVYSERVEWINDSVYSVLNQTYSNIELLIVFDNPSDLQRWCYLSDLAKKDLRIVLIKNQQNIGLTKSLNVAIGKAKGAYIARLDSDDIWKEDKLEHQLFYLDRHPEVDICGTCVQFIDGEGRFLNVMDYPLNHNDIAKAMIVSNPMVHSSIILRTNVIENRRPYVYDQKFKTSQDYALWASLFMDGKRFANLSGYYVFYRVSDKQITRLHREEQLKNASEVKSVLTNYVAQKCNIPNIFSLDLYEIILYLRKRPSNIYRSMMYEHIYEMIKRTHLHKKDRFIFIAKSGFIWHYPFAKILKLFR